MLLALLPVRADPLPEDWNPGDAFWNAQTGYATNTGTYHDLRIMWGSGTGYDSGYAGLPSEPGPPKISFSDPLDVTEKDIYIPLSDLLGGTPPFGLLGTVVLDSDTRTEYPCDEYPNGYSHEYWDTLWRSPFYWSQPTWYNPQTQAWEYWEHGWCEQTSIPVFDGNGFYQGASITDYTPDDGSSPYVQYAEMYDDRAYNIAEEGAGPPDLKWTYEPSATQDAPVDGVTYIHAVGISINPTGTIDLPPKYIGVGQTVTLQATLRGGLPTNLVIGEPHWTCSGSVCFVLGDGSHVYSVDTWDDVTVLGWAASQSVGDSGVGVSIDYYPWEGAPDSVIQAVEDGHDVTVVGLTANDLWWFNHVCPPGYSVTGAVTATPISGGTFQWDVIAGADKIELVGLDGSLSESVTKVNQSSSVLTTSTAPSASAPTLTRDVTVRLTYTDSTNYVATFTCNLAVLTPYCQIHLTPDEDSADYNGFISLIKYQLLDQFNEQLPTAVPWNEDIDGNGRYSNATEVTQAAVPVWSGENWPWGPEGSASVDPGGAVDQIWLYGTVNPSVQNPPPVLGQQLVDHSPGGAWFVGSLTNGSGVQVASCVWLRYRDHGRHQ